MAIWEMSLTQRPSISQRSLFQGDSSLAQSVWRQTCAHVQCMCVVCNLMCVSLWLWARSGYRGTMWNLFCQFPCEREHSPSAWESPYKGPVCVFDCPFLFVSVYVCARISITCFSMCGTTPTLLTTSLLSLLHLREIPANEFPWNTYPSNLKRPLLWPDNGLQSLRFHFHPAECNAMKKKNRKRNQISFGVLGQHKSQSESGVMMWEWGYIYSLMLKSTETEQSKIWPTFAIYRLLTKEGRDLM